MTVNTKQAERRTVTYATIDDLVADLAKVEASQAAGTLRHTGNWSPGQNFQHLAIFMRCALDGFPSGPPAPIRWIITLLFKKKALSGQSPPPGFKIPNAASFLKPADDVSFEAALAELRQEIGRVKAGEQFTHPSPIFGRLTHDQWTILQLGHASLHMSFMQPG